MPPKFMNAHCISHLLFGDDHLGFFRRYPLCNPYKSKCLGIFHLFWFGGKFYEVIFSSPKIVSAKKKKNEITFIFGYNVG